MIINLRATVTLATLLTRIRTSIAQTNTVQTSECTSDPDGITCSDLNNDTKNEGETPINEVNDDLCEYWASVDECFKNRAYMLHSCAKACHDHITLPRYGKRQSIEGDKTFEVIKSTREYMATIGDTLPQDLVDKCKNRHEKCAYWAGIGECEANPKFMVVHCAPSCNSCDLIDFDRRCPPRDPSSVPGLKPGGDLDKMFERIAEDENFPVTVHSRPEQGKGSNYEQPPWVITIDSFLSPEECDKLIELGYKESYKRSRDVGSQNFDGSYDDVESVRRTSENAWCGESIGCREDTVVQQVLKRIESLLHIPKENYEDFQILKYEEGQFYREHHDFIDHQVSRQCGPRILTFFQYLSDVEEGGGTAFTQLGITVTPKKGMVLLWPSVLDRNPEEKDERMYHEALTVVRGVKYAANAWVHLYDYKTPQKKGCN